MGGFFFFNLHCKCLVPVLISVSQHFIQVLDTWPNIRILNIHSNIRHLLFIHEYSNIRFSSSQLSLSIICTYAFFFGPPAITSLLFFLKIVNKLSACPCTFPWALCHYFCKWHTIMSLPPETQIGYANCYISSKTELVSI